MTKHRSKHRVFTGGQRMNVENVDGSTTPARAMSAAPDPWRCRIFWIPVLIGTFVGLLAGVGLARTSAEGFDATGTTYVALAFPPDQPDPFSALQFVTQRIDGYPELGTSPEVLQAVADEIGGSSVADLASRVSVSAVPGTALLRVVTHDDNPDTASKITNSVLEHLGEAIAAVEGGGPDAPGPVEPKVVQPAIAGPVSSSFISDVKIAGAVLLGTALGVAAGLAAVRLGRRGSAP